MICTVVSHDLENETDILAMIGTSAALTISGLPFMGPIGGTRVGRIDGNLVLNPTCDQIAESDLDLIVAGTQEGVLMVESEAAELTEEQMLEAVMFGHRGFQPVIDAIIELAEACAKDPIDLPEPPAGKDAIYAKVKDVVLKFARSIWHSGEIRTSSENRFC